MTNFEGKVAVVTGGGSGLGRELALACGRRGMRLVLADVDEPGMARTAALVRDQRHDAEIITSRTDVSRLEQLQKLAALTTLRFKCVHLLFNNAGVAVHGPVWESTQEDWRWVLGVNLLGVIWGIKAFVPLMLRQGEGHIVNTASAAGWMSMAGSGVYNASKCAVVSVSETLANDLQEAGARVGVTCLSPAFFPTRIADAARNRPSALAATIPDSPAQQQRGDALREAVARGRISATQIAELTLQAVNAGRFYVFPHAKIEKLIQERAHAAQAGAVAFDPLAER